MPLSHHTAKAPTGMIDDAAKLKLEQAKERLEYSVCGLIQLEQQDPIQEHERQWPPP